MSLRQIAKLVTEPTATVKTGLPLLKLATFGDNLSERGSHRHNDNVLKVEGIEGDYDGGSVSIEAATDLLRSSNVAGMIYPSPSYTPEKPRWRVLCPLSQPFDPETREDLAARLNGVFAGQLAPESFTLSQAYYYGMVRGSIMPAPVLVQGDPLDCVDVSPIPRRMPTSAATDEGCDDFSLEPEWNRIREALDVIPADDREEWLAVGMALHSVSSGSDDGRQLWDKWSQACPEKFRERDQRTSWQGFSRHTGKSRTIATLFDLAKQYGWEAKPAPAVKSKQAATSLSMIDPADWAEVELPPREWALHEWIPLGQATYLTGPGSAGKSLLSQQLATCIAIGMPFLGIETREARALYLTCEDDADELHRRQKAICASLGVPLGSLSGRLFLASLAGELDTELCTFSDRGEMRVADRFKSIESSAKVAGITFIALDNVAHLFSGNENARHDVAAFVSLLNRLAIKIGGTVLFIGHPNKAGDSFSGSTAWENQVRSRIFLETPKADDGAPLDRDARTLSRQKSNYARNGESVRFRWHQWAFSLDEDLPFTVSEAAKAELEDRAFLTCLDKLTAQSRAVSCSGPASNYAPRVFSKLPGMEAVGVAAFERAMYRLLDGGEIANDLPVYRRPNRTWATGIGRAQTAHKPACSGPLYTTYMGGAPSGGAPPNSTMGGRTRSMMPWEG